MIIHLTETVLSAPFEIKLDAVLKEVKRISFIITDRAKLAVFNVFNLKKEEAKTRSEEEIKNAVLSIREESEKLEQIAKSFAKEIDDHSNRLKNTLSLHELSAMSGDFSQLVRLQKTRQLRSKVSERWYRMANVFNKAFISILY